MEPELPAIEEPPSEGKAKNIFLWVLQGMGACAFSLVAVAKIVGTEAEVQLFDAVGFGQWFRYFTGALELTGALTLVIPSAAHLGALLLILVMAGATIAHLTVLHTSPVPPLGLMFLMAIVAWGRRKRTALS